MFIEIHSILKGDFMFFEEDQQKINDLWEDMDRLNAMYEELMWGHFDHLEFTADYENDRIIITNKTKTSN